MNQIVRINLWLKRENVRRISIRLPLAAPETSREQLKAAILVQK